MKKSIMIRIIVAGFVLAVFMIVGCAPSGLENEERETVDWQQERAMVQRSLERFDEGSFYVYEWSEYGGQVAAIVADLGDDDKTIRTGPRLEEAQDT